MSDPRNQDLFKALQSFAESVTRAFSSSVQSQPEARLTRPVQEILEEAASALNTEQVDTSLEAPVDEVGRPDVAVEVGGLLCGYVELKAPGTGVTKTALRGRNSAQFKRFGSLPNLVYTDGNDWALYREGGQEQRVTLSGDVTLDGAEAVSPEDAGKLARLLVDFFNYRPATPSSPRALAQTLAPFCRLLRDDVQQALGDESSNVSALAREWRSLLFPEADDFQFADAYAQTLTYALLLASLSGETDLETSSAASALRGGHALLSQVLELLGNWQARREISLGVSLLERSIAAVDPAALAKKDADPWLYFYEDFLAAYDSRLRKDSGAYYTPVEVVRAQVNLVSGLLVDKLDKRRSFADKDVTVLDPATGTGTYPLAVLQHGIDREVRDWGAGKEGEAATQIAENIHAFEQMVGPYAVAHLKLSEGIAAAGGSLPRDGAHVYLSDTLESPNASPIQAPLQVKKLGDEHQRALEVKKNTEVLVCIGNPPYDRQQLEAGDQGVRRKGGWVRFGDGHDRPILEDFLAPAREAGAGGYLSNLYNDYVYFWRWALWKVFENEHKPGVVSFITAASYLRGPGFVGMRELMRRTFDELWILDLEGDNLGARKTENVFNIQTPVAIAVGVRYGEPDSATPARVRYAKIEGSREEKLAKLGGVRDFDDLDWRECFSGWHEPFLPEGEGDYFSWPLLTEVFPWQHSGIKAGRNWPIAPQAVILEERWKALVSSDRSERQRLFKDSSSGKLYNGEVSMNWLPKPASWSAISILGAETPVPSLQRYAFRSLDRQWIIADARLGDRMRPELWLAHGDEQVYMTSLLTEVLGTGPAATVSAEIPDLHHFRGSFGGKHVIPLWRDVAAREPNVTRGLRESISRTYGETVSPEDLFAYAYAVLSAQGYVESFSEELLIPGPRLPITKDGDLFSRAAGLGREMIRLHTYGERFAENSGGGYPHRGRARYEKQIPHAPESYPESFSYSEANKTLYVGGGEFRPVEPEVWEFGVSGLQVLQSWLGYRMRDPGGKSSSPLDEIRPRHWTSEMTEELLQLIWTVEATVERHPELDNLLDEITGSEIFHAEELPQPASDERKPPERS